jgi:membrane associated rhomboid family serine protease
MPRRIVFGGSPGNFWDSITSKLLVVNLVVFILTSFSQEIFSLLALTPTIAVGGMFWQFLTYMYVHAGFFHIFFNMYVLLMFGLHIERIMGAKKFFLFYTLCGIGSALFHILITGIDTIPLVGASGAILGVVTAFGILFPRSVIYVWFIPMPGIVAIPVIAGLELLFGLSGAQAGVANFGHLGGMIIGFILIRFFGFGRRRDENVYFWESDW